MNTSSEAEHHHQIADVRFDGERMQVLLRDGQEIAVPLWWYPRLLKATPAQCAAFEIGRFGIHWEEIDEDIELAGLLVGAKAPEAKAPVEA